MILTGVNKADKRMYSPNDTLSTKNPTWTGLGLNPDLCSGRPQLCLRCMQ